MANVIRCLVLVLLGAVVAGAGAVMVAGGLAKGEDLVRPYWMMLGGMGAVALGLMFGTGGLDGGSQEERRSGAAQEGWVELLPRRRWRTLGRAKIAIAVIFGGGAVAVGGMYLAGGSLRVVEGWVLMVACAAAAGWQGWRLRQVWGTARGVRDVRLWVSAGGLRRGEKFAVKVEALMRRNARKVNVNVRLVCVRHEWRKEVPGGGYDHDEEVWRSQGLHGYESRVEAGKVVAVSGELMAAAEQAATGKTLGKQKTNGWPYCVWEVRVTVEVGRAEAEEAFVVAVG